MNHFGSGHFLLLAVHTLRSSGRLAWSDTFTTESRKKEKNPESWVGPGLSVQEAGCWLAVNFMILLFSHICSLGHSRSGRKKVLRDRFGRP